MRKEFLPAMGTYPREKCHKCGKRYWDNCEMPKTWSCVYCGNIIYFAYGAFKQQIDMVMESARHKEFVKSADGNCIVPKMDDRLRRIRFGAKMQDKKKDKESPGKPRVCFSQE